MFEILTFVFGGLLRLAPEVMAMLDKANERKHERDMVDLNLKADLAKIQTQGNISMSIAELQALMSASSAQAAVAPATGNKWIDGWNAFWDGLSKSVRPVLTYWYCVAAYGSYKYIVFSNATEILGSKGEALLHIWTPRDEQVMASILGFWFVDRALRIVRK